MSKTKFVDCFWGSDFNSTAGFDVLCKRMRDGKQMCQEFEEFIKQRSPVYLFLAMSSDYCIADRAIRYCLILDKKCFQTSLRLRDMKLYTVVVDDPIIVKNNRLPKKNEDLVGAALIDSIHRAEAEEKYGKNLMRLARMGESGIEIGTLKQSWDVVRQETESCGRAHIVFGQTLMEQIEKSISEFREEQKNKRKPVEDNVKKVQRNKKTCFDNHFKTKKAYEQKCREHDTCKELFAKSASQQSKDEEKLRKNVAKMKTAVENSDTNYQSAVKNLEESRKEWEREMVICNNTFQELEKERIDFLRNSMWTYSNLGSSICVKNDELYEDIRQSLEHCDVENDIHLFIGMKQTGSERPAPIHYVNFYTEQNNLKAGFTGTHPPSNIRNVVPAIRQGSLPSMPDLPQRTAVDYDDDDLNEDPTYSTVNEIKKQAKLLPSNPKMVRAEFDYTAQGNEELTLREGDMVKVLRMEDDTWWYGENRGKTGMFPRGFVAVLK